MRLAVVTACWQRPEIFEIFAKHITHLREKFKSEVDIICIVAGSEGEVSEKMVINHGFHYIETPNSPLSKKVNSTLTIAKELEVDYVMSLGSDDLISDGLFEIYLDEMKKGIHAVLLGDFYFYDINANKAFYWAGYSDRRVGNPVGAGIMVSSKFLNLWGWDIWVGDRDRSLDRLIIGKVMMTPLKKRFVSLKKNNVVAVDIKSYINITPLESLNTVEIPISVIREQFPYLDLGEKYNPSNYIHDDLGKPY